MIKYLRIVLALIILTGLISCNSNKHDRIDLWLDMDLSKVFNAKEIESLAVMVEFVDSAVVSITGNKNIEGAYHDYFEAYITSLKAEQKRTLPFDEKEKYDFLERLDRGVFEAIWRFDKHKDQLQYRDSTLINVDYIKCLTLNHTGRYMEYLKLTAQKDNRYKGVYEMIEAMGDFPTSAGLPKHKDFDFGRVRNRLFAAVFILRIEESYETKLDRYFNQENVMKHALQ